MSTTDTLDRATARTEDVPELIAEFLRVLDEKEVERRIQVNSDHFAKYGRLLYPVGSTYATFTAQVGRRYTRIVMNLTEGGAQSCHCFVENATGDVLKDAGWAGPAKGARFNLLDADSRKALFDACGFSSGYLYRGAR